MPIDQRISAHVKTLAPTLSVRRLLPSAARQSVGPFLFFDHFGPVTAMPDDNHDVRPHPHIGLATVTYLFEGAMLHRDSLGVVQRIEPGAINWMTAGAGIVHSERTPPDLLHGPRRSHGLQLWVGLPVAQEDVPPSFAHTPAEAIPCFTESGATVRLLIGAWGSLRSPVNTFAKTLYLDVEMQPGGVLHLPAETEPGASERGVYSVDNILSIDGESIEPYSMATLTPGAAARIEAPAGARFVVIGGEPMDGHRFMWWNFVSSSREKIERAKAAWSAQTMGKVPGETEWIPLPDR
jgi:redox-sensitive bicupin YhaK (pirin superfamily)